MTVQIVNRIHRYDGMVFNVDQLTLQHDDGTRFVRNLVTKAECVVLLVWHVEKQAFLLTKEFRVGSMSDSYGLIAGMVDAGEEPVSAACRELKEESGYTVDTWGGNLEYLGHGYSSSGFTNEKIHFFYAEVMGEPETQQLDHDERIEIHEVSKGDFQWMIISNEINNNHAHACYLRYCMVKGKPVYF